MNYRFDEEKATQAAAYLVKKHGGKMNVLKMMKLLYLANRSSFEKYLQPIIPDVFVSMKNGPVLSGLLNAINRCGDFEYWSRFFAKRQGYDIKLIKDPGYGSLNRRSLRILDEIDAEFHDTDRFELADLTHKLCPEWKDPGYSMTPIEVRDLLVSIGKSDEEIDQVIQEEKIYQNESEIFHALEFQEEDFFCSESQ